MGGGGMNGGIHTVEMDGSWQTPRLADEMLGRVRWDDIVRMY